MGVKKLYIGWKLVVLEKYLVCVHKYIELWDIPRWQDIRKHDREPLFGNGNTFDRGLPVAPDTDLELHSGKLTGSISGSTTLHKTNTFRTPTRRLTWTYLEWFILAGVQVGLQELGGHQRQADVVQHVEYEASPAAKGNQRWGSETFWSGSGSSD